MLQLKRECKAGRANNPILSPETVASLFQPTLTEKGAASLGKLINWPNSQWGIGLCLNCEDYPGRRRKGSGSCMSHVPALFILFQIYTHVNTFPGYGWAGTYFFMDPTSGVAAVCCTQIVPTLDSEVFKVWKEAEEALYEGLG